MSETEQPSAAVRGSELTDLLGPCREAFERIAAPNFFAPADALLQDHWQTWQEAWEAATAAERERCAALCDTYAAERHARDEPGDEKRIQGHKAVTAHVLANRIRGA